MKFGDESLGEVSVRFNDKPRLVGMTRTQRVLKLGEAIISNGDPQQPGLA